MNAKKTIIGIYHKSCTDGTTAGAVLLKKFPEARLFPLSHRYTPEDVAPIKDIAHGADMYFLDCAIAVREFFDMECKIVVLDHHMGIKEELDILSAEKKIEFVFNNEKSGASVAWEYFFPSEPMPELIKYVEDYDLWRWAYGDATKYLVNYMYIHINKPAVMLEFFHNETIAGVLEKGKAIVEYTDFSIAKIVGSTKAITLRVGEWEVPAYNITEYQPYAAMKLAEDKDKVAILFTIRGEWVNFSIRSRPHQVPSALDIATVLGGGGHQNATGAEISLAQFISMIVV